MERDPKLKKSPNKNINKGTGKKKDSPSFFQKIRSKGRERLTIMIIPHTETKILNLHLSNYSITLFIVLISAVLTISIISLVGRSGEDITYYDMGLDNKQFKLQSVKMAEEMIPLHELVTLYSNTISELYTKLNDMTEESAGVGGLSQDVVDKEIINLKELIDKCTADKENCDQELTREILRRIIFLSKQDNQSLQQSIDLSEKILSELKTREKKNILLHTPSIWPTNGYLLGSYGKQADSILGKEIFKRGIEIGASPGAEVYATAPGEITDIIYDQNYGLTLKIEHRYGMRTFYSHLDRVAVKVGDKVKKGQVVANVGRSGNTPLYMLYYEIHVGTVAYNPHAFLNHIQDQWLIQNKL